MPKPRNPSSVATMTAEVLREVVETTGLLAGRASGREGRHAFQIDALTIVADARLTGDAAKPAAEADFAPEPALYTVEVVLCADAVHGRNCVGRTSGPKGESGEETAAAREVAAWQSDGGPVERRYAKRR